MFLFSSILFIFIFRSDLLIGPTIVLVLVELLVEGSCIFFAWFYFSVFLSGTNFRLLIWCDGCIVVCVLFCELSIMLGVISG